MTKKWLGNTTCVIPVIGLVATDANHSTQQQGVGMFIHSSLPNSLSQFNLVRVPVLTKTAITK